MTASLPIVLLVTNIFEKQKFVNFFAKPVWIHENPTQAPAQTWISCISIDKYPATRVNIFELEKVVCVF